MALLRENELSSQQIPIIVSPEQSFITFFRIVVLGITFSTFPASTSTVVFTSGLMVHNGDIIIMLSIRFDNDNREIRYLGILAIFLILINGQG